MPDDRLPITRPLLADEEAEAVSAVLSSGWLAQGPRVEAFERRLSDYVGRAHAVATSSCTTALNLAVALMNPRPGDEVLVPAFTWIATPNAVELAGARPVFVDIDLRTFNINPEAAAEAITDRTVGMLPVHLFGLAAPMGSLLDLARRYDLWVIEDAACALGTTDGGRHVGSFGDIGCFSFHPRKSISTGEGGMLVTADADLAGRARSLRNHGTVVDGEPGLYGDLADHAEVGFNYRLTDIQAAIGLVQMDRIRHILDDRRRSAAAYDSALATIPWITPPLLAEGHSFQSYVCLTTPVDPSVANLSALHAARSATMSHLERQGIETRPGTHAPIRMSYYRERHGIQPEEFPNALMADRASIALPLFAGMTSGQVDRVAAALRGAESA